MKVLLIYVSFNRMGTTVKSLNSVLSDPSDFEMIIVDNNSKDKTREYLNTLTDPRIKEIKYFDQNVGVVQAVNYGLSKKKPGQDTMIIENDCNVLTKDFVNIFKNVSDTFGAEQVHCSIAGMHDNPSDFQWIGEYSFKESGLFGLCHYQKSSLWDALGFYCESSNGGDVDINMRLMQGFKKKIGYTYNVRSIVIQPDSESGDSGWNCNECYKLQNICRWENRFCGEFYPSTGKKLHGLFWDQRRENMFKIINERLKSNNLKAGSIFVDGTLTDEEIKQSLDNRHFFASNYDNYLKENKNISHLI